MKKMKIVGFAEKGMTFHDISWHFMTFHNILWLFIVTDPYVIEISKQFGELGETFEMTLPFPKQQHVQI